MSMTPEAWKEIEELYQAVAQQAPERRAAMLANARPDLREIVDRMLAHGSEGKLLDRPVWENDTLISAVASAIVPGSDFGHYRVEAAIGAGGMGEVYRAVDTRLARKVAIKSVRMSGVSPAVEARFLEEARAASALNHPNIITIYDIGATGGRPYIVMEWVEGQTLRQKLARGPLSIADLLTIALQIADALVAAHESHILHRDLKPENVMLTADGRVKVVDFGLAKRIAGPEDGTEERLVLTAPGAIVGTPAYMSPEQIRGEPLDFRSDQFSFGALLYEMTAGKRAFSGKSAADLQSAILFQQPEPLTRFNPSVPAPLQWLVERCLAKSAAERFASTSELRSELASIASGAGKRTSSVEPVFNLPVPRNALIGREDELARLRELATDPDLRLLTLTGAGGIGKTRLAIELARQLIGNFPGGVCFVPLEKVNEPGLVPSEVARVLGVLPLPGQTVEEAIGAHLRRNLAGAVLLLLDNFEHVLEAAAFVAGLASDRLKIVATSRAPLRIYGEYEFPVPSLLSFDATSGVTVLAPAVRLFLERAPGLRRSTYDAEQLRVVSEICARLDGLPLAIELAAARTKLLPLKTLRERLDDPLGVLVGGARDLPQRQHTLRATLDWSYNLLDTEHQKLFRRMAVFVGGAGIEAIEAVCNTRQDLGVNIWDALELLADNSLIRHLSTDDAEPRFAMLETMREYGLERLAEAGEEAYVRKAQAAFCVVLAEEEAPHLRRERTGKHRFDAELGNFRAALDWLAFAGEVEWGLRLATAIGLYFISIRLQAEGLSRITRLLALPGVDRFPTVYNWGKYVQADFQFEVAGSATSIASYLSNWKSFEDAGDQKGMLHVATRLSHNYRFVDWSEARRWSERAVEVARAAGQHLAGALSNLADVVKISREFAYARTLYLEAMRLFKESGDRENAIWSLSHQADLYREEGNDAQARTLYQQALAEFRTLGSSHGVASCLHDLASFEIGEGRFQAAQSLYRQCLRLYGPENKADLPRVLESMAAAAVETSRPDRALMFTGAAAAIRERFYVRSNPAGLAKVENCVDRARKEAGAEAPAHWMKGWNMSAEEVVEWASRDGEE